MKEHQADLDFSLKHVGPHFAYTTITIPDNYVKKLYSLASSTQQLGTHTPGFLKGTTPLSYIESNFQPHLLEHIKEFFFKYFVISWLHRKISDNKILLAGQPRLTDISITPLSGACYSFSLTLAQPISLQGWKRLPFKAPRRKNYKDLDRQVKNFLKEEATAQKNARNTEIQIGDWVHFSVQLLDMQGKSIFEGTPETLWLKIGFEEADLPFNTLFIGKKIGDTFVTTELSLQEYFSSHIETHYPFSIKVLDFTPFAYFDLDEFKKHFKIKNNQELHEKMIEVFSYRNDISQRRSTAEETLKLLLSRHAFDVPNHLVLRQQKEILDAIHDNPDYQVYRMQDDFNDKVKKLAIKQVKEVILTHQLAYYENITVGVDDIKNYLNLTKRPRTKEFIYFEPPHSKFLGQEMPLSSALLEESCLREKTLNYAIHSLSKQKTRIP
ncbi:hypothetical protein EBU95_14575 [bacterium]|nr:hypothetical protein [bacterium]